ncbi:MAG TPA: mechanosensitive ion channel family protein [Pseudobdellovibrionaceae bacterium]|nr:mechanosensitive ion channel family protein [Pseudobdellovibrionaceae bacterium]
MNEVQVHPWVLTTLSLIVLIAFCSAVFFVCRALLIRGIISVTRGVSNVWAQALLNKKFLFQVSWLLPVMLFHHGLKAIPDIDPRVDVVLQRLSMAVFIVLCLRSFTALFESLNQAYSRLPVSRNRPIKGLLQVASLVLYLLAAILIVSILFDRSPLVFISGLGAMTAILLLIFKDTILSLVAGVQLTSNDLIRVGDWIEMPQFNADGDVVDLALNTVKVQNWDRTITVIPAHKFLENSFKNWRGMQESGGRRIKRSVYIDMSTIRFLTPEESRTFERFQVLRGYLSRKFQELEQANHTKADAAESEPVVNRRRLTNVGTFRAYLDQYLRSRPDIRQDMTFLVRQLDPTPKGLPLEIYVFTKTTAWGEYERIQADIFDHILAIAPEFGLRVYQEPSAVDVRFPTDVVLPVRIPGEASAGPRDSSPQ